jgi:hypothetical protein
MSTGARGPLGQEPSNGTTLLKHGSFDRPIATRHLAEAPEDRTGLA